MYQNSKMTPRYVHSQYNVDIGIHALGCLYLGVSLGPILDVTNQVDYVKALHLLLHEFECHNNETQKPKMVSISFE
jgi:hypothetical protein